MDVALQPLDLQPEPGNQRIGTRVHRSRSSRNCLGFTAGRVLGESAKLPETILEMESRLSSQMGSGVSTMSSSRGEPRIRLTLDCSQKRPLTPTFAPADFPPSGARSSCPGFQLFSLCARPLGRLQRVFGSIPASLYWEVGDYPAHGSLYLWGPKLPADFVINHELRD